LPGPGREIPARAGAFLAGPGYPGYPEPARVPFWQVPGVLLRDPGVLLRDPGVLLKDPGVLSGVLLKDPPAGRRPPRDAVPRGAPGSF